MWSISRHWLHTASTSILAESRPAIATGCRTGSGHQPGEPGLHVWPDEVMLTASTTRFTTDALPGAASRCTWHRLCIIVPCHPNFEGSPSASRRTPRTQPLSRSTPAHRRVGRAGRSLHDPSPHPEPTPELPTTWTNDLLERPSPRATYPSACLASNFNFITGYPTTTWPPTTGWNSLPSSITLGQARRHPHRWRPAPRRPLPILSAHNVPM